MIKTESLILLVDDSGVNIEIMKDALKGYKHLIAKNGDEAIKQANVTPKPDLILLDVIMPGKDGYEVCKLLKNDPNTRDIPVVFITAQAESRDILKGFEAGAVDYITKPFNIPELKARVKTQLSIKIARDQNIRLINKIKTINKKLTDSIEYAQKIQKASFPNSKFLSRVLPEYFILLKPKDVVSGDFYWVGQVKSKTVVVAADCTGHGVPGAITSMLGIAYLHELVEKDGVTRPDKILNHLRHFVIESFQQDATSEVQDGMDASIITIDQNHGFIEYAGAFNPLYYIRNGELNIVKADHMPVSFGEVDKPYQVHKIPYYPKDCFFLFSDGFASQFGGEKDKKINQPSFRQLLLEHYQRPMLKQKIMYDTFFESWKAGNEQVDDVLLIGIRF